MRILPPLFIFLCLLLFPTPTHAAIELTAVVKNSGGEIITLEVGISGTDTPYYIQAIITQPGETSYFGYNENNNGDWFPIDATPDTTYIVSNFYKTSPVGESWSGELKVKNDPTSANYKGPGEYNIKVRRYTGNSTSHTGDEVILSHSLITPTPTPIPSPTPTPIPSPTPKPTSNSASPSPSPSSTPTTLSSELLANEESDPQILGDSDVPNQEIDLTPYSSPNPSPPPSVQEDEPSSTRKVAGILLILAGLTFLTATGIYFYKHKRPTTPP